MRKSRPAVLVFAGCDPSGGAGIAADIEAIAAQGAHALPVITALTVQDNDRVYGVYPVATDLLLQQAQTLVNKIPVAAIKIGIIANLANATALAHWIGAYKARHPALPVILDPVLASGHGDLLSVDNAVDALAPLLRVATCITPNLPEAAALCPTADNIEKQAHSLMHHGADILIKGGHASDALVTNIWFHGDLIQRWQFPRIEGSFHGSGCTLASALAGQLAIGQPMHAALDAAQHYCHQTLEHAYAIADGQCIPQRHRTS